MAARASAASRRRPEVPWKCLESHHHVGPPGDMAVRPASQRDNQRTTPSAMVCAPQQTERSMGREGYFYANRALAHSPDRQFYVRREGSPGGLQAWRYASYQETPQGRRYSVPEPAGESTGAFCARMCARQYRPQPRYGSGVNAGTVDGSTDDRTLCSPWVVTLS